jgi:hypothetical protein
MITAEEATRENAIAAFGKLLDARPPAKRVNTLRESMIVETVMLTALSYLQHALPALDASKDAKMHQLAKQARLMLGIKEEEKKTVKKM